MAKPVGTTKTLLLAGFCVGAVACAAQPGVANPYATADRKLAAFDRQNPDCQLWTNWQKMCSRTGPDGATYCVTDPGRPVEPSEPFCTDSYVGYYANRFTRKQTESVLRFCDKTFETPKVDPRTGRQQGTVVNCERFQSDRPFNGKRIAARLHPWCSEWSDSGTMDVVCSVNTNGESASLNCGDLSKENYENKTRMFCSATDVPVWCSESRSFYDFGGPDLRMTPTENLDQRFGGVYFDSQIPLAAPVYGMRCESRRAQL